MGYEACLAPMGWYCIFLLQSIHTGWRFFCPVPVYHSTSLRSASGNSTCFGRGPVGGVPDGQIQGFNTHPAVPDTALALRHPRDLSGFKNSPAISMDYSSESHDQYRGIIPPHLTWKRHAHPCRILHIAFNYSFVAGFRHTHIQQGAA